MPFEMHNCPFCNSSNVMLQHYNCGHGMVEDYIECRVCHAKGPSTMGTREDAIKAWNRMDIREYIYNMGDLRDDDPRIYEERALLEWARSAPTISFEPGDYEKEQQAYEQYDYEIRKWLEKKPQTTDGWV